MDANERIRKPGLFASMRRLASRHRALVASFATLGMVAGALYGLAGQSTYTAESRLLVGTFEAPSTAMPGYVLASQTLAANYARLATSTDVLDRFATELGIPTDEARGRVTVTAIPESAIIRVTATSPDADQARADAEAMATALNASIKALNATGSGKAVLDQYRGAVEKLAAAISVRAEKDQALAAAKANGAGADAVATAKSAADSADLDAQTAQLTVTGLETQYKAIKETLSTSSQVRTLGGATVAKGSTMAPLLLDALVGLVAGLVVGLGVAWWRDGTSRRAYDAGAAFVDGDGRDAFGVSGAGRPVESAGATP